MRTVKMEGAVLHTVVEKDNSIAHESVLEKAIADFARSVEITRDVRFQANLRLSRRQRASSYVISFLSLYVIALSLIPNIVQLKPFQGQILLACSVILSVFIIFTSLIDASQNFFHQGELLHQCARKIATINHQIKNIDIINNPEIAKKELEKLQEDYKRSLDDCPVNHDNMDFYREVSYKPHLFELQYSQAINRTLFKYCNKFYAIFLSWLWIMPHLLALSAISLSIYWFILSDVPLRVS